MSPIQKPPQSQSTLPPLKKNNLLLGKIQSFLTKTENSNEEENVNNDTKQSKVIDQFLKVCTSSDDDNDDDDDDSVSENRKQKQPCVELRFTMGDFDDTAIAAIEEADDVDNIDMAHFPSITTNSNDDNEGNGNMQEKKRKKPLIQELS